MVDRASGAGSDELDFKDSAVEIGSIDLYSRQGEGMIRASVLSEKAFFWPAIGASIEDFQARELIVAKVDGVLAGRAILEAVFYPFAEIENLEVAPAFRGRGLATRIVADAIRRASEMGFLGIHLQTEFENAAAHRLYAAQGMLPANQGKMLRLIRFLNHPALAHFLREHPLALFDSRPATEPSGESWSLSWRDPLSEEGLSIGLSGGSCQEDGEGFGPGVASLRLDRGSMRLRAAIDRPRIVSIGESFGIEIDLVNRGERTAEGACRLLLNPGFAPGIGTEGAARFRIPPMSSERLTLPARVTESLPRDLWKISAYPSVSVGVEFHVEDQVFWLSAPVKIKGVGC